MPDDLPDAPKTFTGLARQRTTPRSVRRAERMARAWITLGGVGTIGAVLLIFAFLLWVVFPLFSGADAERLPAVPTTGPATAASIVQAGIDDSGSMGWTMSEDGRVLVRRIADGTILDDRRPFDGSPALTCISFATGEVDDEEQPTCAFGFADGTIRSGRLEFVTSYLEGDDVPEGARTLRPGGAMPHLSGMLSVTPKGQVRLDRLSLEIQEPVKVAEGAIERLDFSLTPSGAAYAFLAADGTLQVTSFRRIYNMMLDEHTWEITRKPLVYRPDPGRGLPAWIRLSGIGNTLYLIWSDGRCLRFDARAEVMAAGGTLEVVEVIDLLDPAPVPGGRRPGENTRQGPFSDRIIDRVEFMVGKTTLVVADDQGRLLAWFPTRPGDAYARDGIVTRAGHVIEPADARARVTALVPSKRSRLLATAHEDGTVRLFHLTTSQTLLELEGDRAEPVRALALTPQEDGVVAWSDGAIQHWSIDIGHPEATVSSLLTKVWYEGQPGPVHAWQSEGGSDDFEPKLGLIALIFGTLKATFYSILIAAPIAIFAAIFTSEFLVARWRAPIKSVIEMMASLPSVVLGFIAAIVLAPYVRDVLMLVLCAFLTVPFTMVLGARLWQLLPGQLSVRLEGAPRFAAVVLTLPLSLLIAAGIAPAVETWCFNGDVLGWLNRGEGSAQGGWTFLLLPLCLVVVGVAVARFGGEWLRKVSMPWTRMQCAIADLVRLLVVVAGGILLAVILGAFFGGTDPRGATGVELQYQPRNAMIVGFVMGFAIVPIIYTLAEDALSSVPSQLREGSLGCGATPWQTAWRIVVPTATSGIFGALMVGLGRAVGETMIVLMAAGNTPILEWNPFSGFRTLSANIATELPEAVKNSTHYRVLFLAGLALFAMTFFINTIAEFVRRHFRKRFADL